MCFSLVPSPVGRLPLSPRCAPVFVRYAVTTVYSTGAYPSHALGGGRPNLCTQCCIIVAQLRIRRAPANRGNRLRLELKSTTREGRATSTQHWTHVTLHRRVFPCLLTMSSAYCRGRYLGEWDGRAKHGPRDRLHFGDDDIVRVQGTAYGQGNLRRQEDKTGCQGQENSLGRRRQWPTHQENPR